MKTPKLVALAADVFPSDDSSDFPAESVAEAPVPRKRAKAKKAVTVTEDAAVADPEPVSPFAAVAAPLRKALEDRGFTDLTVVQRAVLADSAMGRDLQISSQTGSGKTVALGLVLAPQLLEIASQAATGKDARPLRALRGLVIVPTRELAVQVSTELAWLYAGIAGLTVECMTGGSSVGQERRRLERKPTVVVGTPGRLLDHIRTRALDCSSLIELVLDEADRMLDMGFREELEAILEATPAERRTHLVSATFPSDIQKLARKYQKEPLAVQGTRLGASNEDIEHVGHLVRLHDRFAAIVNLLLLTEDERTLIFVNTRAQASELADQLAGEGFAAAAISGELEQSQRTRTLDAFRSGVTNVLVATDVAARGLDIADVALVIHTDAPFDAESYTHRAGRTGRAGRKGRSVLLSTPMRQKKVEYLLSRARVKFDWREVPSAANVEKALAKRERRRIREALTAATEPTPTQISFAEKLLEDADPSHVVASLIELCRDPRRTAPREVETFTPTAMRARVPSERGNWQDRPDPRERSSAPRGADARPMRRMEARDAGEPRFARRTDSRDSSPAYSRGDESDRRTAPRQLADRFEMNWGHEGGATPQRVLAVLCRRGDVTSRAIGTIDIDSYVTSFEVARENSRDFEHNASMPDDRDPRLIIRRARARERVARRGRD
ncbi:MAG TPA: DEAD/DEAH box helicase [Candidatus Binatia bacterium]|jgi:ATP-dependent RNA helicase DeaD